MSHYLGDACPGGHRADPSLLPYACLECGQRFELRSSTNQRASTLEAHWSATGHGPRQAQADAIDRARANLVGDDAPPPEHVG